MDGDQQKKSERRTVFLGTLPVRVMEGSTKGQTKESSHETDVTNQNIVPLYHVTKEARILNDTSMLDLLANILFYAGGWAFALGFSFGLLCSLFSVFVKNKRVIDLTQL